MSAHNYSNSYSGSSSYENGSQEFLQQAAVALVKIESQESGGANNSNANNEFFFKSKIAQMETSSAQKLAEIENKTSQRFNSLEEKLNKMAILLEKQHAKHPEHFNTPVCSPNTSKKPIIKKSNLINDLMSEDDDEDEQSIEDCFIPYSSKWRLYTQTQLINKLRGYYNRAIESHNKEAEDFLFAITTNYKTRGIEWLRTKLLLFKEGSKMSSEERARMIATENRPPVYKNNRGGYRGKRGRGGAFFKKDFKKESTEKRDF